MLLQAQMRAYFESFLFPSCLLHTDEDFTLAAVNRAYHDALGHRDSVQDPVGQSLFKLLPEDTDGIRQVLARVLATKEPLKTDVLLHKLISGGIEREEPDYSLSVLTPVRNHQEEVEGIICSFLPREHYALAAGERLVSPSPETGGGAARASKRPGAAHAAGTHQGTVLPLQDIEPERTGIAGRGVAAGSG